MAKPVPNLTGEFPRLHLNRWIGELPGAAGERERTFGVEPLIGWRMWKISSYLRLDGTVEPRLAQISGSALWHPRVRAAALCTRHGGYVAIAHEAPDPDCTCGLWAVHDRAEAEVILGQSLEGQRERCAVFGTVAMWGRVLEFEKGYRAQYAYPQLLYAYGGYASEPLARELEQVYGVEVRIVPDPPGIRETLELAKSFATMRKFQDALVGMNDALARLGTATTAATAAQRKTLLVTFASAAGQQVLDVYTRAVVEEAEQLARKLHEAGIGHRRVSRRRFEFESGGSYELIAAANSHDLQRHLAGRRPDVIDLPPEVPDHIRQLLEARGTRIL